MHITVRARSDEAAPLRCALCHDHLGVPGWTCDACGAQTHAECSGDCPTLGCRRRGRFTLRLGGGEWRRLADRQRFRVIMASFALGLVVGGVAALELRVGPAVLVALALGAGGGAAVGLVAVVADGLLIPARLDPRRRVLAGQSFMVGLMMLMVAAGCAASLARSYTMCWSIWDMPPARPGLCDVLWGLHLPVLLSGLVVSLGMTGFRAVVERLIAWTERRWR